MNSVDKRFVSLDALGQIWIGNYFSEISSNYWQLLSFFSLKQWGNDPANTAKKCEPGPGVGIAQKLDSEATPSIFREICEQPLDTEKLDCFWLSRWLNLKRFMNGTLQRAMPELGLRRSNY